MRRKRLPNYWRRLITERGGPEVERLGAEPEQVIIDNSDRIREFLVFWAQEIQPLKETLKSLGFDWKRAYGRQEVDAPGDTTKG
ncbi:MAG: hypothetical protein NZ959_02925 [Armatimonadetes bacterium]|nr:hypothetical protein [Armatimonadota bacterium]MDW8121596.1 hypothetical protein [Armatimonadota bacterium]